MRLLGSARFVSACACGGMTTVAVEGLGWVGLDWVGSLSRSSLLVWLAGWLAGWMLVD